MRLLFLFLCCISFINAVCAADIYSDIADSGVPEVFDEYDYFIAPNTNVFPSKLIIDIESGKNVVIENHGLFQPDELNVCENCNVFFENYNQVNIDAVVLNSGAQVFQIISNSDNMNSLNINADYTTLVQGINNLSLADIVDFSDNNSKIVLNDVTLNIDKMPVGRSKSITLGNNVTLVISDSAYGDTSIVLDDVVATSAVRFVSDSSDVMFVNVGFVQDGKLTIERVRETDYSIIFDDNVGNFINSLRDNGKNDKLMLALDSAPDKDSLYSVMYDSVLFNPSVLLRPLQIVNAIDMQSKFFGFASSASADVFGVMSDDFILYGTDINLFGAFREKFRFNFGAQISGLDYASDIDDFSGNIYGVNLGAGWLFDNNIFVDVNAALSIATFDISSVMYDDKLQDAPDALFGYFVSDVGYMIKNDSYMFAPVAGLAVQAYDLSGYKYSDYMMRVGVVSEYKYVVSDLEYVYGASVIADSCGTLSVSGKVGFVSPTDKIGGDIGLSIIRAYDSLSYKAFIDAKIMF